MGTPASVTPQKPSTPKTPFQNQKIANFENEEQINENLVKVSDLLLHGKNMKYMSYDCLNLTKFDKDNFEFGTKLGKGKFGDVYLAREKKTNFIVAVKVLDKASIRQMKAQKQVIREIKIHSYLDHRNIIKLYGVFHDDQKVYMIIEYAPDGELYKELKNDVKIFCSFKLKKIILIFYLLKKKPKRRFSEKKTSNYIKQVIDAFIYLHELDIIHRDLKPENLLNCFVIFYKRNLN